MIETLTRGLASAFLAGRWEVAALVARGAEALQDEPRWLWPLARRVLVAFPEPPPDGVERVAAMLRDDEGFQRAARSRGRAPLIRRWLWPEPEMVPVSGPPAKFAVPALAAQGDLARALGVSPGVLDWFADARKLNGASPKEALAHYRHQWVVKKRGGHRLLEAPKPRLREIQRSILRNVLAQIPVSPHAHGFVTGRDVRSFARPHVGRAVVVRLDLEDFFASVSRARIAALFRRVGYRRAVAGVLANLSTVATPERVLDACPREGELPARFLSNMRLRNRHLPQGAPTSPALSNLAAYRLDARLAALAAGYGATMTRYADDVAFSGAEDFARSFRFLIPQAAAIALEEGFRVNHRKTRVMRGHSQSLCGVLVNDRLNVPRRERDRLRAVLFNVGRHGADSQNRDGHADFAGHLAGRIAWMTSVNPGLARRLRVPARL